MESGKTKQLIKNAKKSIQDKDYEAAIEHCELILKIEPKNYNALVLKGLACQESCRTKESLEYFLKATQIDSEQILAWKGLSVFYEKNNSEENNTELLKVYKKIIELLESDKTKQFAVITKLVLLSKAIGNSKECVQSMILSAEIYAKSDDCRGEFCAWTSLINFILDLKEKNEFNTALDRAFDRVLECVQSARASKSEISKLQKDYLIYLYQKGDLPKAIAQAKNFFTDLQDDTYPIQFICQSFCYNWFSLTPCFNGVFDENEVHEFAILLEQNSTENSIEKSIARMALGTVASCKNENLEALPILAQIISASPELIETWCLLIKVHLALHNYKDAETTAMRGIQQITKFQTEKSSFASNSLVLAFLCAQLCHALIGLKRLKDAELAAKKCRRFILNVKQINRNWEYVIEEIDECEARISIMHLNFDLGEKLCDKLKTKRESTALLLRSIVSLKTQDYIEAERLITLSLEHQHTSEGLHILSVIQWEHGQDRPQALRNLLKATKMDPFLARNYLYLGHFYKFQCNPNRAQQCYLKAFDLDIYDPEICKSLSDLLLESNEDNLLLHISILKSVTEKHNKLLWGWFRLGLCYFQPASNKILEAITCFQNAIRIDNNDSQCWECLGDSYLLQGSYIASLKAFTKVTELREKDVYAAYQVAKIKHLLGYHKDALIEYESILDNESNYLPAIEGVVKCKLGLATNFQLQSLFELAKDHAVDALMLIIDKVLPLHTTLPCFFKLAGDLSSLLASLGSKHFPMDLPFKLYGVNKTTLYSKADLLNSATCCFGRAVSLDSSASYLWHDLGVSYFELSKMYEEIQSSALESAPMVARSLDKSMACLRQAIELSPEEPRHWAALGTAAASANDVSNVALAQHCLVKALNLEPNNVTAWANLGLLYLKSNNTNLAHQAFNKGQSVDPSSPNPWIGQSIIAESINHPETCGLFRHATVLGNDSEGSLGYGYWMCKSILSKPAKDSDDVNDLNGWKYTYEKRQIIQAADALLKLTGSDSNCSSAFCHLSILLERNGLIVQSLEASKRSLALYTEEKATSDITDALKANLGRLLRSNGFNHESVSVFSSIENPDVSVFCESALSFLAIGSVEKAYQAYEKALHAATSTCPELLAHIITAMAFVARKIPSLGVNEVKTLLFKSFKCKPQSVPGLLGLCAIGFMESDVNLTNAVLKELEKYKYSRRFWPEIANLLALNKASQGDFVGAVRQLSKAIHWQPGSAVLWSRMATFLLMSDIKNANEASRCAYLANVHKTDTLEKGQTGPGHELISVCCNLAPGNLTESRRLALKAVHSNPGDVKSWSCLAVASLLSMKKSSACPKIFGIIRKLIEKQNLDKCNSDFKEWLLATECYSMLAIPQMNINSITKLINTHGKGLENGQLLVYPDVLLSCLSESSPSKTMSKLSAKLDKDITLSQQTFLWMTLVKVRVQQLDFSGAESDLLNWLKALGHCESSKTQKLAPLLFLALVAKEAANREKDKQERWLLLGQDAVAQILKLNAQCSAGHFLGAILAIVKGGKDDIRFAKRCLERCLQYQPKKQETAEFDFKMFKTTRSLLLNMYTTPKRDIDGLKNLLEHAKLANDKEMIEKLDYLLQDSPPDENKN